MKAAILTTTVCTALALGCASCFTGIESTPRISGGSHGQSSAATAEARFASVIEAETPATWRPGKQWLVSDNKISIIFTPPTDNSLNRGDTLMLADVASVPTIMGTEGIALDLRDSRGNTYRYIPGVDKADFDKRSTIELPFTIELAPVAAADSLLRGNTYYIRTPYWYDAYGQATTGLRHVPVKIQGVTAGTAVHPLRVAFTCDNDSSTHYAMMTYGSGTTATRNFDRLFSFTDPRHDFPLIEDATWQLIIHSRVAEGMTRDECRLALGAPASLHRGATSGAQIEYWSYDDGVYLIFEDDILTRFRQ